jgi:hypothetical protein
LEGATGFLTGLEKGALLGWEKALLWLKVGDVEAARRCINGLEGRRKGVLEALVRMAEGKYDDAVEQWRALLDEGDAEEDDRALMEQNLAVCLLYRGQLMEVCS